MLFLILISASGLTLNHADALGLSRHAAGPWLLGLYGADLPPVESAYSVAGMLFATSGQTLYADGEELAKNTGSLVGAVAIEGAYVVATGSEFIVSNSNVELIERYAPDLSDPIGKLGISSDRIIVAIQNEHYEFNPQRMSLSPLEDLSIDDIAWSQPANPSDAQAKQIGTAELGHAINWERVLLDFHSGRILPAVGRYIADLTALCLLYMCFTGIVLWARRR